MNIFRRMLAFTLVLVTSLFAAGCSGDDAETTGDAAKPDNAETGIEDIEGRFDEFEE